MANRDPTKNLSPFKSLERAQMQRFVMALCTVTALLSVFLVFTYGAVAIMRPAWQTRLAAGLMPPTLGLALVGRSLTRKGHATLVGAIMLPYMLIMVNGLSIVLEVYAVMPFASGFFISIAAMVLGTRAGYGMAMLSTAIWFASRVALWPAYSSSSPLGSLMSEVVVGSILTAGLFSFAFVGKAATSGLWQALDDAAYDLVEANRQLEEANQLKSSFVARMSHDLRTPLNAIMLSIDLTLRKLYGDLSEKQEEVLGRTMTGANRLVTLINDILDISRLEAGELELSEGIVEISALVDALDSTSKGRAFDKDLDFSLTVAPSMPSLIIGDEVRLTQILTNLTDNAIKFTDQGEVSVSIEPVSGSRWRMSVRDTGRGIHEADFEHIFDEFRRASSATRHSVQGSGLGLAIAKQLAHMMGGDVRLTSQIGKGSTFVVTLPLEVAQETTEIRANATSDVVT